MGFGPMGMMGGPMGPMGMMGGPMGMGGPMMGGPMMGMGMPGGPMMGGPMMGGPMMGGPMGGPHPPMPPTMMGMGPEAAMCVLHFLLHATPVMLTQCKMYTMQNGHNANCVYAILNAKCECNCTPLCSSHALQKARNSNGTAD